ncbi:MAG: tRNA epoxyqueuosine(34) reductase QueG [Pseudomonadota bacterium]
MNLQQLERDIQGWGQDLGFARLGVSGIDLSEDERRLERWLALGRHGEMQWMARHGRSRTRPQELIPGTVSVITARMDYLPEDGADPIRVLRSPNLAYVSRYALGRDYHKVLRRRLQQLADRIVEQVGPVGYRVFVDSAPVMEKALARNAGLGWIGKHTNLLHREAGSWFFLGELYTDLPLAPHTSIADNHCGSCTACIDVCPTAAIVAPYELDARRCISYLTIELKGSIPIELRPLIGNRVYGCDDCQLFCPWNKFAQHSKEGDFSPRHALDEATLIELFEWTEAEFLQRTQGSAIRRIGYERWQRNLAVALGNAPKSDQVVNALRRGMSTLSSLVREHVQWALGQHCADGDSLSE